MKKVLLLVVVFLIGSTTQSIAQNHQNVQVKPGKKHRYYNSQEIAFVENGVLYSVRTDGTFSFNRIHRPYSYKERRNNHNVIYYPGTPGNSNYYKGRRGRGYNAKIKTNRYGQIIGIGRTCIFYKRNGKVKAIGSVPMQYFRGRLVSVGNLEIIYNRFGKIRSTTGHVNRNNRNNWHDDWYNEYNDDYEGDWNRRSRKKKNK